MLRYDVRSAVLLDTVHEEFLLQTSTTFAVNLASNLDATGGEFPHFLTSNQAWSITIELFDAHINVFGLY